MTFELTDEIRSEIIFAMEDQGNAYVFDAVQLKPVPETRQTAADDGQFYHLPAWDSTSGFRQMERFVSLLRNPVARESLRGALASGRGVFRAFKTVLKEYPEVERLWLSYKSKEMNSVVTRWYETLCGMWGVESLDVEPDDDPELLEEDFVFREPETEEDADNLFMCTDAIATELALVHPDEPGAVVSELWQEVRCSVGEDEEFTLVAETVEGDFAGCITVAVCPGEHKHTVLLTALYVVPRYRGLGVGRTLLERCQKNLQQRGVRWMMSAGVILPPGVAEMLRKCGFCPLGTGLIANL